MTPSRVLAGLWLAALVALVALAFGGGVHDLPHAYLAAWLVIVALPLGALAVLMALETADRADAAIARPLRLLLATLPIMALFFVPVVLDLGANYPWARGGPVDGGFAARWFTPMGFGLRALVYGFVWLALAACFVRPARATPARRNLAAAGLLAHLVVGTLAAFDWSMSLDPSFVSSVYGVMVIGAQIVSALAVAGLMVLLVAPGEGPGRTTMLAILVASLVAAFAHFSQYLVVWSANLPKEIVWYQTRWQDLAAPLLVYGAPLVLLLAIGLLLPSALGSRRGPAMVALLALGALAMVDLAALASPRETFTIPSLLIVALFGIVIGGVAAVSGLVLVRRETRQVRHG